MSQKGLSGFFEEYLKKDAIFKDKKALQANYTPETIPHREKQIKEMAQILAPVLKTEKPSNLFLYGKTGTGKTLSTKYVSSQIEEMASKNEIPLKIIYVNCKLKKVADTEYRLMAHLAREFGKEIPVTGLPTDEIYNLFFESLDISNKILILILDEIDELVKKTGDRLLYNLTRINSELKISQLSLVGISNNLTFSESLDPRVKSSLSEEELVFPPYNAIQLQDILNQRAKKAFKQGRVAEGVISKCAAYAAREHGDARRALDLLRVAGEITERNNLQKVELDHIDEAEKRIERDRVLEIALSQPKQFQATLYSIIEVSSQKKTLIFAGEVYDTYKKICIQAGLRPLTQRRLSDIISELDMLGVINAKIISKGRYGRTREIKLAIPQHTQKEVKKIIEGGLDLS
ncbi:ORC1-type DNA replication protein [Candidatus Woesearchaeota archaeon]|nr:ORC1-type DNA replication protein [Candidatus Woesearchaeota archaeon]MBL7050548.1 ORC1-type DNA replication protein [Candidatus Woesearchaeota archaeon]